MDPHSPTVLHVISSLGVLGGGAQRQLLLYFQHRSLGWSHVVAYRNPRGVLREDIERAGVRTVWLGPGGGAAQLLRLVRLVRREGAALIHTHLFEANQLGRLTGVITGVPVVTSLVSTMEVADRVASGAYRQPWKYRLSLTLEAVTARATTMFIAISETVKTSAVRALRLPPGRFRVVYRAVQAPQAARRSPSPDGPVLISVGRLVPSKGHDLLIRMLAEVRVRWPRATLQIVGDGPELGALRRLAEEVGVASNVQFLGLRSDVPGLLRQADLFVYASWFEGFTLVVAEATAAGVPVVTVDLPVTRETAPLRSVVFVPRDPRAFAAGVLDVLADLSAFKRAAEEESGPYRERFSVESFVRGTEAVYAEVLRHAGSSTIAATGRTVVARGED